MKENMMLTDNQKTFLYWIEEREKIRLAKEANIKAPWSMDKIFQETYFCNINRENDKVTKWIRSNWTYPHNINKLLDTEETYDFSMIVARVFNKPKTLDLLGQPTDKCLDIWFKDATEILEELQFDGKTIWNGAYIISTNGKKIDKATYCLQILEKASKLGNITKDCETLEEAHKVLMKIEGLASFLAAQVVADLKNTNRHHLNKAPDWKTFSAHGPGSLRGLTWFFEEKITAKNYQEKIRQAYEMVEWEIPDKIMDTICYQDLQNCFCEYDKYMRIKNGTGRSKRKYNGKGK